MDSLELTRLQRYSRLDEFEAHYPGTDEPISWLNYVWFQCRWQRLAAAMFEVDGESALMRFWEYFHAPDRAEVELMDAASWAPLLARDVSETLGQAIRDWH